MYLDLSLALLVYGTIASAPCWHSKGHNCNTKSPQKRKGLSPSELNKVAQLCELAARISEYWTPLAQLSAGIILCFRLKRLLRQACACVSVRVRAVVTPTTVILNQTPLRNPFAQGLATLGRVGLRHCYNQDLGMTGTFKSVSQGPRMWTHLRLEVFVIFWHHSCESAKTTFRLKQFTKCP